MTTLVSAYEQLQADASALVIARMRQLAADELERRNGDRTSLLAELEDVRARVRELGGNEDLILDLMDYVYGWCSPRMKIRQ